MHVLKKSKKTHDLNGLSDSPNLNFDHNGNWYSSSRIILKPSILSPSMTSQKMKWYANCSINDDNDNVDNNENSTGINLDDNVAYTDYESEFNNWFMKDLYAESSVEESFSNYPLARKIRTPALNFDDVQFSTSNLISSIPLQSTSQNTEITFISNNSSPSN